MNGISLHHDETKKSHFIAIQEIEESQYVLIDKPIIISTMNITIRNYDTGHCDHISRCANWECFKVVKKSKNFQCPSCNYTMFCDEKCYQMIKQYHDKICDPEILNQQLGLAALFFACGLKMPAIDLMERGKLNKRDQDKISNYINRIWKRFPKLEIKDIIEKTLVIYFAGIPFRTFMGNYEYANGLFLYASYINHSCDPNCYYYMVDNEIRVRASRKINPGEEITIAYDQEILFCSKDVRNDSLLSFLGKECRCIRCNTEMEETKIFEKVYNRPGKAIMEAIKELTKEHKAQCNMNMMLHLSRVFEQHFVTTHSLAYELFKKYGFHLWETARFDDAVRFIEKLKVCVSEWGKVTTRLLLMYLVQDSRGC